MVLGIHVAARSTRAVNNLRTSCKPGQHEHLQVLELKLESQQGINIVEINTAEHEASYDGLLISNLLIQSN